MLRPRRVFINEIEAAHDAFLERFEITPIKAVHALSLVERQHLLEQAESVGLLVHQPVADGYAPASTNSVTGRLNANAKTISFPVLWFDGYTPDMVSLKQSGSALKFPSNYHSRVIANAYAAGYSALEAAQLFDAPEFVAPEVPLEIANNSIGTLARRESELDIHVSKYIEDNFREKRLFFTFNHPTGWLLYHVADEILSRLGLPPLPADVKRQFGNILGRDRWPDLLSVHRGLELQFERCSLYRNTSGTLDIAAMCESYYRFYDQDRSAINTSLRLAPDLPRNNADARPRVREALHKGPQGSIRWRRKQEAFQTLPNLTSAPSTKLSIFQKHHHLLARNGNYALCYMAKNACSTLKYHFLLQHAGGELNDEQKVELNKGVHGLVRPYAMDLADKAISGRIVYAVVREPFQRLVSAFTEKFVRADFKPRFCGELLSQTNFSGDRGDYRFCDFIQAITTVPVETLNEHWMPQHLHLIDGVDYEFIDMRSLGQHPGLKSEFDAIGRNVRTHSTPYGQFVAGASAMTTRALQRHLKTEGYIPSSDSFVTPHIMNLLQDRFGPDTLIFEAAWRPESAELAR